MSYGELKTPFLRANLFKKVGDIFVDREDFLFVEKNTLRLSRNMQKALSSADDEKKLVVNEVDLINTFGKTRVHELHRNEVHTNKF
jgi:hypothetical protein